MTSGYTQGWAKVVWGFWVAVLSGSCAAAGKAAARRAVLSMIDLSFISDVFIYYLQGFVVLHYS